MPPRKRRTLMLVAGSAFGPAMAETAADRSFVDGYAAVPASEQLTELPDLQRNSFQFSVSREQALDAGLVEPTVQEVADRAAQLAEFRIRHARRVEVSAGWFMAILDAAGPVGAAAVGLHTPSRYSDCEGCGFEDLAGLPWPCATVLAAAEAAGLPEPAGI